MASYLADVPACDTCIAGAGIIGLSLALELASRGGRITLLDAGQPLAQASTAAAGMLAAADPENPSALTPLARLSLELYPAFLHRIEALSGTAVSLQTSRTLQALPPHAHNTQPILSFAELAALCPSLVPGSHRFLSFAEHSLDPVQLAAALLAAVRATPNITLYADRPCLRVEINSSNLNTIAVHTPDGPVHASQFVDCTGAWSISPVTPRKGQMLYVEPPPSLSLSLVLRTPEIYIVPRTSGPHAGHLLIGATIEDAGFDTTPHSAAIAALRAKAAELLPPLAAAPIVHSWAGLRPGTPDDLPILGQLAPRHFIASGHYRNGILLAPATAHVMAQLIHSEISPIDLTPYSPSRFR